MSDADQSGGSDVLLRVRAAAARIKPYIHATPILYATLVATTGVTMSVHLKLENLQVGCSAQVRGVLNAVLSQPPAHMQNGLMTVYEDVHHVAAVEVVGGLLGVPVHIFAAERLRADAWLAEAQDRGTTVTWHGVSLYDVSQYAAEEADRRAMARVATSSDAAIVAGVATLVLELFEAPARPALVVVPPLGSLLDAVGMATKAVDASVRVLGVELAAPPGRDSHLHRPLGMLLDIVADTVDGMEQITAAEQREAAKRLWRDFEIAVSAPAAGAVAALLTGKIPLPAEGSYAVVAAAGHDGLF
ncbi:MAG: pyridoxal-phosphate dependent enzyme [Chloroflexi bacterium]|nr:pyridoxal-phosphate dependent enzyme [Chloroflexota bacterium]